MLSITESPTRYGMAVYSSSDDGASWALVRDSANGRFQMAADGTVYVNESNGILRSIDMGRSWDLLTTPRAWQRLHPLNPSILVHPDGVVTGLVTLPSGGFDLMVSTDAGRTWNGWTHPFKVRTYHRSASGVIMAHLYDFDNPDPAHGIYRSTDNGTTWEPVVTGTEADGFRISSDSYGTIYISGQLPGSASSGTDQTIYRSTDDGATFQSVRDSVDIFQLWPTEHGTFFVIGIVNSMAWPVLKSTDSGTTWRTVPTAPSPAALVIMPNRSRALYYGSHYYDRGDTLPLHRSLDDGESWERFDEGLPKAGAARLLEIPGKPLFVATSRGIYRRDMRSAAPLVAAEKHGGFDVVPNPLHDHASILIDLASRQHVRVTLHDMLGRTVGVLADGERESGRSAIEVQTSGLAAGSYIVRMSSAEQTISRLLFIR